MPIDAYGEDATRVRAADDTTAFDCRRSGRAAGEGVDVRLGMAVRGGLLVQVFALVGWSWGGQARPPDYAHFSANGR
ncbi:MAG TPA: M15 family metallopeptidase [Gaiellaceae bacterium]|nr:M15 family metallopeptidase [Gaiellaceae bacterium]